jgi:hypothetical protein
MVDFVQPKPQKNVPSRYDSVAPEVGMNFHGVVGGS